MALYRVLRNLKVNGGLISAGDFILSSAYTSESLQRLEDVGAIGLLHAPPLSELPGFEGAAQLATIGIVNADQLLEEIKEEISARLDVNIDTVLKWKAEVSEWLIIPVRAGG